MAGMMFIVLVLAAIVVLAVLVFVEVRYVCRNCKFSTTKDFETCPFCGHRSR